MRALLFLLVFSLFAFASSSCSSINNILNNKKQNQKINNLIDLNSDGSSELLFWNCADKDCFFEALSSQNTNYETINLGNKGDIPLYGDFNGDGSCDFGVYQFTPGNNKWLVIDGLTKTTSEERFGEAGDLPVPSDYDGDGRTDYVIYRPRNSGFYGNLSNKNKWLEVHFGLTGDIPVPRDYDGDGKADLATYRTSGGNWLVKYSRNNKIKEVSIGGINYLPIPGDYDGDGKSDFAVWNKKNNECKILFSGFGKTLSEKSIREIKEKLNNIKCFPISSDYNGDKKSELAFWDFKNKKIHLFQVSSNDLKYNSYNTDLQSSSKPVTNYLLNWYIKKISLISSELLYKKYLSSQSKHVPNCIPVDKTTTSSVEKQLTDDFDGDGKCDDAKVDLGTRVFTFQSSNIKQPVSIPINPRADGIPFSLDLDGDFRAELIFFNEKSKIFGYQLSSEAYRYDEVLFSPSK